MEQNKFFIFNPYNTKIYYIAVSVKDIEYSNDKYISNLLEMDIKEYIILINKFGGINHREKGVLFKSKNKAQHFIDYLNDKYLVMLKLAERV